MLFGWKFKPSVHGQNASKSSVVRPLGALLCRRRDKAHGHDFHALGVEEVAVGHGGGRGVVDVADLKLSSDFWLGGRAHSVGRDWDDGHGVVGFKITWRLSARRFRLLVPLPR